ncbi:MULTISPECIES: hypothetical protein [Nitrosopumilus]|uniref:Uncharacterized protein n=1 Tax=Nitrosopumilus piranensis TaxID=1582439 RepID=A0A0C5BYC6_9ARCH|nr:MULTISPECIES: hypothetical protein [Nitrosopumilus]AJM93321.1 hypothetical protein NPIRD3C_2111 [Nitrosopumilus piranensis]KAF6245662.1 hypothetical protein C6989_00525 [Nitrosopumilus sp. b2]
MTITLEISTKNYSDDSFNIKKALSHMETLTGGYNGYVFSEPTENFGWTFFKIAFKPELHNGIVEKFDDMLSKYRSSTQEEKFAEFMKDYFASKNCDVKIKVA